MHRRPGTPDTFSPREKDHPDLLPLGEGGRRPDEGPQVDAKLSPGCSVPKPEHSADPTKRCRERLGIGPEGPSSVRARRDTFSPREKDHPDLLPLGEGGRRPDEGPQVAAKPHPVAPIQNQNTGQTPENAVKTNFASS